MAQWILGGLNVKGVMEITITLTPKEAKIIQLVKKKGSLSTSDNFGGYRDSPEWRTLCENKLLYHSNRHSDGDYIRYSLTELGELAFNQIP